ncbi:MAG: hypothetical protein JWP11_1346 [Frankiales bacterium]|nr:hypothetical protein [Frankiales bacterium]
MPLPTYLSFLGIAKETTKGTAVAASDYIPVTALTPQDTVMFLADKGMRGSQVELYNEIQGPTMSEYSFAGDVFPDTIGYVLAGLLGDVTTTGASAPFSHAFAVKNSGDGQPPSYTLSDYNTATTRQFAAMQFSEASFKFSGDGLLSYSAKALGNISTTTTKPTQSFSAVTPIAAWKGVVTIGGGAVVTLVDGTCELKRSVEAVHTLDGSANPYKIWGGPVAASGKMTFLAEDESQLLNYLNNSQPSLVLDFQQGAGAALTEVKFQMSRAAYTLGTIVRGKDYVAVDVSYDAIANTTDAGASGGYSPVKATVQSAKASGTYA